VSNDRIAILIAAALGIAVAVGQLAFHIWTKRRRKAQGDK